MLFKDQLGREIYLDQAPKRIVSLVPSQTELLHYLGLGDRVVGITKFCIHPQEWFATKERVGGTKNFKLDKIHTLQPDLIIANKEENTKVDVAELALSYPVWISDIKNVEQALAMIISLGEILGKRNESNRLVDDIHLLRQKTSIEPGRRKKCIYLIWKDPYMTVGGDTFISDMLNCAGFSNVYADAERYPEVTIDDIVNIEADYVLLSSEPYPFKDVHLRELEELCSKKIILVDGEMFSWYGSRLLKAWEYFPIFVGRKE